MKKVSLILFTVFFLIGLNSSCASFHVKVKKDNGKHKGWNKNTKNPHHSNSTNPGKEKGKSKGKPKK